jgi:hypothetical protein
MSRAAQLVIAMLVAISTTTRTAIAENFHVHWLNMSTTLSGATIANGASVPTNSVFAVPGVGLVTVTFTANTPTHARQVPLSSFGMDNGSLPGGGDNHVWTHFEDFNRINGSDFTWSITYTFPTQPAGSVYFGTNGLGRNTATEATTVTVCRNGNFLGDWGDPTDLGPTEFASGGGCFTMRNFLTGGSGRAWNTRLGVVQITDAGLTSLTAQVAQLAGDGIGVAIGFKTPCTQPPGNMVAWWTLDEPGPATAFDMINVHNGAHVAGSGGNISFIAGYAGGAYEFGATKAYVGAGKDVGNFKGDFTVDAWVKLDDPVTGSCGTVIAKEFGGISTLAGYRIFVNNEGKVCCSVGLGAGAITIPDIERLNPGWNHVTVKARRFPDVAVYLPPQFPFQPPIKVWRSGYNVNLFVNGWWRNSNNVSRTGTKADKGPFTVANPGEFRIGQYSENHQACEARLAVDEVELFDRVISDDESFGLAMQPKCKCRAEVCSVVQYGQGEIHRTVMIRIWNDGPTGSIPWTIEPCIAGDTRLSFSSQSPSSVLVPRGSYVDINVTITLSAADILDANGACFKVTTLGCSGRSIAYGRAIGLTELPGEIQCVVEPMPCFQVISVKPDTGSGGGTAVTMRIRNTSNAAADLSWFVRERPMDGDSMVSVLRLNGLPPGTPTSPAALHIPANSTASVTVDVSFAMAQALGATHLELLLGAVGDPDPTVASDMSLVSDERCGVGFNGWMNVVPDSTPPAERSEGTIVFDAPNRRLVLFGGYDGSYLNDVWTADMGPTPVWTRLTPAGTPPVGRASHTAIYDAPRHRMIVFAGSDGSAYRNDVWALSLDAGAETWIPLTPAGSAPPQRRSHSAIYDAVGDRMIIFGGYFYRNDTWALSLSGAPVWQQLNPSGPLPSARQGHSAVYDAQEQRMITFGGEDGGDYQSDVWILTLDASPAWISIPQTGAVPSPRRFHYAALDSATRVLNIFGGEGNGGLESDVWSLPLADPTRWTETTPGAAAGPGVRTVAMGPGRDVDGLLYLFGGIDSTSANGDLWALPGNRLCSDFAPVLGVPSMSDASTGVRLLAAPNPFRATTAITFTLPARQVVSMGIYDVAGRAIRKIEAGAKGPGPVSIRWDGLDSDKNPAHPGIYMVKVRFGTQTALGRLVRVY